MLGHLGLRIYKSLTTDRLFFLNYLKTPNVKYSEWANRLLKISGRKFPEGVLFPGPNAELWEESQLPDWDISVPI